MKTPDFIDIDIPWISTEQKKFKDLELGDKIEVSFGRLRSRKHTYKVVGKGTSNLALEKCY